MVDLSAFDKETLIEKLSQLEEKKAIKKTEMKTLRNWASRNEEEIRSLASRSRKKFDEQVALIGNICPYCECDLQYEDSHLEHIYPVSRGGLSVDSNLVYICKQCNSSKKAKTLRAFAMDEGYSLDDISMLLDDMGKDF